MTIEHKAASDGVVLFRWHCPACSIAGAWLARIDIVRRNGAVHEQHVHGAKP